MRTKKKGPPTVTYRVDGLRDRSACRLMGREGNKKPKCALIINP